MGSSSGATHLPCIKEGAATSFPSLPEAGDSLPLQEVVEDRGRELPLPGQPPVNHTRPLERPRIAKGCSTVSMGYFDREGVSTLSRSLRHTRNADTRSLDSSPSSSEVSEATLNEGADKPFDFEKVLRYYLKKLAFFSARLFLSLIFSFPRREEADIKLRELGVGFENLRVVGLGASASYQPTLGSLLNPKNIFSAIKAARHPPLRDIISGFEGVVRPGEMLCTESLKPNKFVC